MAARHFAASLAACIVLALFVNAQQAKQEGEQCLLQRSRSKIRTHVSSTFSKDHAHDFVGVFGEIDLFKHKPLAWTTNVGQDFHDCSGSHFKTNYSGTRSGMVVKDGMILKVGHCAPNGTVPTVTQGISCQANATGCHMWCAPVWQSYHDTQDWGAFDERCRGWDGESVSNDAGCVKMGQIFTWARVELPQHKNHLALTYAITKNCTRWCSPLWVTIYDKNNWAKAYRWCVNRKDDWGMCDDEEVVSKGTWHDKAFDLSKFMQKHGYLAEEFVLELAVYSEFEDPEVMFNSLKLSHVNEDSSVIPESGENCGSQPACGVEHQCCRKGNSEVEATCCPKAWSCCEDSCCPNYYNCTITDAGHTCKPPIEHVPLAPPALCSLA